MNHTKRIGLLGGSFNPAHRGHRRLSLSALGALGLDEIWWLVSPGNPLKPREGMAPLAARFGSAIEQARDAPIRVTAIEREFGSRYTADTLRALKSRYPEAEFAWLMGADNLAQFHRWHDWRGIAESVPIAVVGRPGYDKDAAASPAMAWLQDFEVSLASFVSGGDWSAPTLVQLRFDPDASSATAIRGLDPIWASRYAVRDLCDQLTLRPIGHDDETQTP